MKSTDRSELTRLVLYIERDLAAEAHLGTLLVAARKTTRDRREELRLVKDRLKRRAAID